jgi:hypothetical protein
MVFARASPVQKFANPERAKIGDIVEAELVEGRPP